MEYEHLHTVHAQTRQELRFTSLNLQLPGWYLKLAPKTIYGRVERMEDEFKVEKKRIYRLETLKNQEVEPDLPSD